MMGFKQAPYSKALHNAAVCARCSGQGVLLPTGELQGIGTMFCSVTLVQIHR